MEKKQETIKFLKDFYNRVNKKKEEKKNTPISKEEEKEIFDIDKETDKKQEFDEIDVSDDKENSKEQTTKVVKQEVDLKPIEKNISDLKNMLDGYKSEIEKYLQQTKEQMNKTDMRFNQTTKNLGDMTKVLKKTDDVNSQRINTIEDKVEEITIPINPKLKTQANAPYGEKLSSYWKNMKTDSNMVMTSNNEKDSEQQYNEDEEPKYFQATIGEIIDSLPIIDTRNFMPNTKSNYF